MYAQLYKMLTINYYSGFSIYKHIVCIYNYIAGMYDFTGGTLCLSLNLKHNVRINKLE